MKKKLSLKDELQAWGGAFGVVAGLFILSLLLGVFLMDYDPRTMLEGIAQDFKNIFG